MLHQSDMSGFTAKGTVLVPGNHDGVHLGHRALLDAAKQIASEQDWLTAAMFFDPHPLHLLAPSQAPPQLTTPARRTELLKKVGADIVMRQHFDAPFAALSPSQFVSEVLVCANHARALVVGPDFRFGHARAGDLNTLKDLGKKLNFSVHVVEPIRGDDAPVSSSRIRDALSHGDIARASSLLGRYHDIDGTVVRGHQRGRTLGFPTANLDIDPVLAPPDGVYTVIARTLNISQAPLFQGVANIGVRPTFKAGRSIEVHLFDTEQNLYDARLRVAFVNRVRNEQTFPNLDALRTQIERDTLTARHQLEYTETSFLLWI